ncbi:MAG: hypothetical protein ACTSP4_05745 [Candidatus Hodarchaeales archaeon]
MTRENLSRAISLGKALQQSNPETTEQIVDEMVNGRRQKICEDKCVSNRVVCVLRPMCPRRQFLDIMIITGITLKSNPSLPLFCYRQRVKEFRQDYQANRPFLPGAIVFSSDLLDIVSKKKKKRKKGRSESQTILDSMGDALSSHVEIVPGFHAGLMGKNIFFLEEKNNFCVLNPEGRKLDSQLLKGLVELFTKQMDLEVEVIEEGGGLFVLEFNFTDEMDPALLRVNMKNLKTEFITGYDEKTIICEIYLGYGNEGLFNEEHDMSVRVKALQELFEEVKELAGSSQKRKEHKKQDQAEKKKEKR